MLVVKFTKTKRKEGNMLKKRCWSVRRLICLGKFITFRKSMEVVRLSWKKTIKERKVNSFLRMTGLWGRSTAITRTNSKLSRSPLIITDKLIVFDHLTKDFSFQSTIIFLYSSKKRYKHFHFSPINEPEPINNNKIFSPLKISNKHVLQ